MFCTFRHTGQADDVYTLETTPPPYSKKREGKFVKVACVACRLSKLKCSGEPNGCQRCLDKKITCQFPPPASSGGNTQSKESSPPSEPPYQEKPTSDALLVATPPDNVISIEASSHEITEQNSNFDFELLTCDSLEYSEALISSTVFGPTPETGPHPAEYTAHTAHSQTYQTTIHKMADHNVSSIWPSPEHSIPTPSIPDTSEFCYTCLAQAVKTHEGVKTAVWAQKEMVNNTNTVLMEQKNATIACEDLLSCQKCSTRPAYIMLLLSTCDIILGTLESICRSIPARGHNIIKSRPLHDRLNLKRQRSEQSGNLEPHGDSYSQSFRGISRRKGHLDDEDELLMLQTLAKARVRKLDGLLDRLHVIIKRQDWAPQNSMVRDLKDRLIKVAQIAGEMSEP